MGGEILEKKRTISALFLNISLRASSIKDLKLFVVFNNYMILQKIITRCSSTPPFVAKCLYSLAGWTISSLSCYRNLQRSLIKGRSLGGIAIPVLKKKKTHASVIAKL